MTLVAVATGPQGYRGNYTCTPQSAHEARHDVQMILSTWQMEQIAMDAQQVVAELMANAVSHCDQDHVLMELVRTTDGVRISVQDSCTRRPVMKEAAPTDQGGRGLFLVAAFSSAWDWEFLRPSRCRKPTGKRVWADLTL